MGFVKEVQSPNPPFSAIQVLNLDFMSKHPHSYKALRISPCLVEEIRETEINLNGKKMNYIPKSSLANTSLLRKVIRNGDILAIVTNVKGLDIAHLGIALWRKDGLHMLHASSKQGGVVEDNNTLRTYLNGNKSFLGIRVLRLTH